MRRRSVLATVPPLLVGCVGRSESPDNTTTASPTVSETVPPTGTRTEVPTETHTETPTEAPPPWAEFDLLTLDRPTSSETDVRERLADHDCTALGDDPVCPGEESRVTVELSQTVASLPAAEIQLSVHNDADETFQWNSFGWKFLTFDGHTWRGLSPLGTPQPLTPIAPGRTHTYTIQVNHQPFEDVRVSTRSEQIRFHGLGPGVYGLVNDSGYFGDLAEDPVPIAATFGFSGQAPPLRPTNDIVGIHREGSELVVESERDDLTRELLVRFVDEADTDLLPEHIRMVRALRNTVSFAPNDGIDSVRYVADPRTINAAKNYLSAWTPPETTSYGIAGYAFTVE